MSDSKTILRRGTDIDAQRTQILCLKQSHQVENPHAFCKSQLQIEIIRVQRASFQHQSVSLEMQKSLFFQFEGALYFGDFQFPGRVVHIQSHHCLHRIGEQVHLFQGG